MRISDWSSDVCSSDLLSALTFDAFMFVIPKQEASEREAKCDLAMRKFSSSARRAEPLHRLEAAVRLDDGQEHLVHALVVVRAVGQRDHAEVEAAGVPDRFQEGIARDVTLHLRAGGDSDAADDVAFERDEVRRSEHTSELQSLMRISYAVFCLKKKKTTN